MAPIDDDVLEKLLKGHLSARLDGQLGRAESAFRQRLASDPAFVPASAASDAVATDAPPRSRSRRSSWGESWNRMRWLIGIAGTAVAASLATLFVLPHFLPHGDPRKPDAPRIAETRPTQPGEPGGGTLLGSEDHPLIRYVHNSAWDEGTITHDESGQPLRRVRYQQVEHLRYYDPERKATIEMVVPRENVQLYKVDTY